MGKKLNVIEINGKRYDAHSGTALDHGHQPAKPKPILVTVHQPTKRPARQAAKTAVRHQPQKSKTLMRRAVKRPSVSTKMILKVQGHTGALVDQPTAEIAPKLSFGTPDTKRLGRASRVRRSNLIMHFNPNASQSDNQIKVTINRPVSAPPTVSAPKTVPRQTAPDIDAIFERAIQHATSHLEPAPKTRKKHRLHLGRKHARA